MTQGVLFEELERDEAPQLSEYDAFVEKFKPKKTTDDCYTPPNIYDVVATWVGEEYGLDRRTFVRPFYPGGDYENFDYPAGCCVVYPAGCCVVDNPPFSILAKIADFYLAHDIKFFLFAPSLTTFSSVGGRCCAVMSFSDITYANGALVRTSFITNLEPGTAVRSAPVLHARLKEANAANLRAMHADLPKYEYPAEVLTASKVGLMSQRGVEFSVPFSKAHFIRVLDAQRPKKKTIFGAGYLLSSDMAKARAEAQRAAETAKTYAIEQEQAAVTIWPLSDRERAICDALDGGDAHGALFDNK